MKSIPIHMFWLKNKPFIGQPDRISLKRSISRHAEYLRGRILDVGAGRSDRYGHMMHGELVRMDVVANEDIDLIGDATNIPCADESFDAIICTQVLEHVSKPWLVPAEFARVLKVGGYLVLTVPQVNELHEEPNDYFRYTKYGLRSLFEESGFKTILIERRGGFYSQWVQSVIRYTTDLFGMYDHAGLGRIFGRLSTAAALLSLWLDSHDISVAGGKYALGWCAVFQKI